MSVALSGKFSGEVREEKEHEESAESEKTAAVEATRRATERAARIRAALGATLEKSPLVTAALRRAAQAKAGREIAKDDVAVELQIKDRPKAATELEQGPSEPRERPKQGVCRGTIPAGPVTLSQPNFDGCLTAPFHLWWV